MPRARRTNDESTDNVPDIDQYGSIAVNERWSERILARPVWLLLLAGGAVSMGLGAALVFVPPLLGAPNPASPNPTDALGLATLLVITGSGMVSGGLVVCLVRIGVISGRSRRRRD